jgi:hypothetical protein
VQHRSSPCGWLGARGGVLALVFVYLILIRTRGIADNFWLLGDQIRDWSVALGPWHDLPLSGVPSVAGGTTLGPVYYWTMWVIRHVFGPWTDMLPHAGGIGLSTVQSTADVLLLAALWKKTHSGWLAFAVAVLVATEPFDMSLTAAMWNPELAVALVKVTMALVLIAGGPSPSRRLRGSPYRHTRPPCSSPRPSLQP